MNLFSKSCLLFALAGATVAQGQYSALWGRDGEKWTSESRLPDFSYAGYHRGEAPLPVATATANVKAFGAVGDGEADDTAAIQKAIDASKGKVVRIPPGRYKITDFLTIRDSGTVLQGAGPEKSVFFFLFHSTRSNPIGALPQPANEPQIIPGRAVFSRCSVRFPVSHWPR